MKFEAKKIDLKLELKSLNGEEKTFFPKEEISTSFADKIIAELNDYLGKQEKLSEKKQDRGYLGSLKCLSWIYEDFDSNWVCENFTIADLNVIRDWAIKGLTGIKEDGEN